VGSRGGHCVARGPLHVRCPAIALRSGENRMQIGVLATGRVEARTTMPGVMPPDEGDNWLALTDQDLPIAGAYEWAVLPGCGAVVLFSGTVRDHAAGRDEVQHLTYEAYEEQVRPVFTSIAAETRTRWPKTGRIVLLHRTGRLELEESSVIAVVSAPHRPEAFEAARYAIDALKEAAPIWKHEVWADGSDWGTGAHELADPRTVGSV
jgi:molybdopterin synthase catalytic subunit